VRSAERDALQRALRTAGVDTLIHYPIPPHRQAAYGELGFSPDAFPIATRLADEVLSLPIGPHLEDEQQERVIDAIRASVQR
jgi:dTDP-4-amino-4,6-dideoxygalactose transaminase